MKNIGGRSGGYSGGDRVPTDVSASAGMLWARACELVVCGDIMNHLKREKALVRFFMEALPSSLQQGHFSLLHMSLRTGTWTGESAVRNRHSCHAVVIDGIP